MFYERRNTRKVCVNFQPVPDGEESKRDNKDNLARKRKESQSSAGGEKSTQRRCKGCNYLESEHFNYCKPKPWSKVKTWRSDLHLDSVDFGHTGINRKIKLVGNDGSDDSGVVSEVGGIEKTANLTILADDSHPLVVVEHLLEDWHLSLPNICISVIGTTGRHVTMLPRYLARLKQGLLSAVCSTSCWVLTGGTNQGVDAITCDALKDAQLTSWMGTQDAPEFEILGIVNWNCISQHQQMSKWTFENPNCDEAFEYHVRKATFDSSSGERFPAFNPMCSYFVGVESGIQSNKGAELFVRSSLEELIQADPNDSQHFNGVGLNIPTVLILIGGDFDTFERASNAVEKEIPIILCEGSGLATDILATGIRMSQKNADYKLSKEQEQVLIKLMETQLSTKPPKGKIFPAALFEGSRHIPYLRKCVKYRKLVFFYRIDLSVSHLDVAIMRALLKSGPARRKDPVQLAVRWNRCDEVVEDHLKAGSNPPGVPLSRFTSRSTDKKMSMFAPTGLKTGFDINEKSNIKELVTQALLEDKPEFIKLFLEHGLDIRQYLTTNQLAQIYETSCAEYPPLVKLLKKARNGKAKPYFKIKHVYNLIHTWTSASPQHDLRSLPDRRHTRRKTIHTPEKSKSEKSPKGRVLNLKTFEDPFRELCIWAILTHKMEMALFFWSKTKSPLMMALISSRLWEAHRRALPARDEETRLEMAENSVYFAQLAIEMIELSWQVNKQMAQQLVTYKYRAFGRITVMDLSAFIEAKEIIAHPLMQVAIDGMWKGGLRASLQQVLIAFLFPFRIPIFFRESETNSKNNNSPMNKTSEQSDGQGSSGGDGAQFNASRRSTIVKDNRGGRSNRDGSRGHLDNDTSDEETHLDVKQSEEHEQSTPIRKMKPIMDRPPSISEFLQEDEITQKMLKAKRDLIRRTEVAKLEALRREKKKLLETSNEGDVFARAAAALQKIQHMKELTMKNYDEQLGGSRRGSESMGEESGAEGEGQEGEAEESEGGEADSALEDNDDTANQTVASSRGRTGSEIGGSHPQSKRQSYTNQNRISQEGPLDHESDSEVELDNENDHDICKYQVQHLGDEDDYQQAGPTGSRAHSLAGSTTDISQGLITPALTPKIAARFLSVNKKLTQSKEGDCAIDMESRDSPDPKTGTTLAKKASEWFQSQMVPTGTGGSGGGATRNDLEMKEKENAEKSKKKAKEDLKKKCSELQPKTDSSELTTKEMLFLFYTSPIAKFCMHTIAYLVFLNLFTISTFETGQGVNSIWGMLSFQFMVCYALEAYRQLVSQRANWGMKLRIWAMSEWNIIELVYLSMGLVSFPLTEWEATRNTAIVMNCGINMLMWIRLLRFYQCSSKLGPMWIMIRKMMAETLWFMAIMVVLLFAFGIFIFAVNVPTDESLRAQCEEQLMMQQNPDIRPTTLSSSSTIASMVAGGGGGKHSGGTGMPVEEMGGGENMTCDSTPHFFWMKPSYIFLRPYLMSLGNQFLDWTFQGRQFRFTTWMCFFFVVIGNALMLNLLVAIYGGIFNEIVQKADIEWKTEMYWLMKDFKSKTFLPPPISIVETLILWLHFVCLGRNKPDPTKTLEEEHKIQSLAILESYCVQTVLETRNKVKTTMDVTNGVIRNREINCGKIQESIQNIHDLRTQLSNRKHEREEKRRERQRISAANK